MLQLGVAGIFGGLAVLSTHSFSSFCRSLQQALLLFVKVILIPLLFAVRPAAGERCAPPAGALRLVIVRRARPRDMHCAGTK